ncbi:nitroreductase family protein [Actinomadura barringtoniae]|uniref:Nitroreductase family protein n=1 Tax=Actinomadura barringtoniae TaxID=1427535 RepID=A0A939T150_9ACTN|nr:nitroreductase family protein [Actinomadura barringtoniae]MBO2446781.1 nitroreductase family protein [Actinomadura barringtoniae]
MDPVLKALGALRATRWFTGEPVADEALHAILEAARWTGSARNRQPWRFVVVRDRALLTGLSRLGAYAGHLAQAPLAVLLAVNAQDSRDDAEFDAGRAAQTIMLAAHAFGLGSCPASFFPADNVERAGHLVGVGAPWRIRTGLSVGHPAPAPLGRSAIPTGRLALDELVIDR